MNLKPFHERRLASLRAAIRGVHGLLVSNIVNVRYLTGFTGSSGYVLVTGKNALFITDPRYGKDALGDSADLFETVIIRTGLDRAVRDLCRKLGVKKLGFETTASYGFYERLKKTGVELRPLGGVVEPLRAVKDGYELECIKGAVKRAEEAFREIRPVIRAGAREQAVARRLEEKMTRKGSQGLPFPAIVASGPNSAIPHARPTERKMAPGDLVVIDWGAEFDGYCSDMTRTLLIKGGRGADVTKKKKIYETVLKAQQKAIAFIGASGGKDAKNIDNSARYVIKQADYGEYFTHGLGHGVGLEVHELPGISSRSAWKRPVSDGMVITIEPGIYVPGVGGVRIEDMVFIEKGRPVVLTGLPRQLF
ncbi:MAG: Xaa-Pro peptidase family protein [Nitrospiraceae bacterium]|nr:Xaa-Pro peptidase family protein [Nitrospiraceae bacterium]